MKKKLTKKDVLRIRYDYAHGARISDLATTFKLSESSIFYHITRKPDLRKRRIEEKERELLGIEKKKRVIVPANGKPFSYSATIFFWGSMIILLVINLFFLWGIYGKQ
jgi:replicative superfamily II helicase